MAKNTPPVEPVAVVGQEAALRALPPRPWTWLRVALVVLAVGALVAIVAHMLERPAVLWGAIVAALVVAVPTLVLGSRHRARGVSLDGMIQAANSILQASAPTRELVTASRWKGGWIGHPERLKMRYPATLVDSDPKFMGTLTAQVSSRMGVPYSIQKNDPRRCVLVLERAHGAEEKPSAVQERIDMFSSVVGSMLPGARVTSLAQDDAAKLSALEFTWPANVMTRAVSPVFQGRIAKTLQATAGQPLTVTFDPPTQTARAVPLTPLPDRLPHPPRNAQTPMRVEFGMFRDGRKCIWNLDAPLPHLLIVGGSGGGKTVLLLTLLTALPEGMRIHPIDPKRVGLMGIHLLPGAMKPATRPVAIVDRLLEFKRIMDDRFETLETVGTHMRGTFAPEVLVIDEGEEMNDLLADWWTSGEGKADWMERYDLQRAPAGTKHPAMKVLGSILRLGREARMHVILASQQAAADWLGTSSRSQFAVRIALRNLEVSSSIMQFGTPIASSGLENVSGRAWVSLGMGMQPEHAQIYWTPKFESGLSPEDTAILDGLGVHVPDARALPTADAEDDTATAPVARPAVSIDKPAPVLSDEADDDDETADDDEADTEGSATPVLDLDDGMRVLIDIDGQMTSVTVESVEPDDDGGEGYLLLSYVTDDGEPGAMAVADTETVQAVDAVPA